MEHRHLTPRGEVGREEGALRTFLPTTPKGWALGLRVKVGAKGLSPKALSPQPLGIKGGGEARDSPLRVKCLNLGHIIPAYSFIFYFL